MNIENHCGTKRCPCTHTEGCVKGWIWYTYEHVELKSARGGEQYEVRNTYEAVKPCHICDPDRAEIFATSTSKTELDQRLQARSTHNRIKHYDNDEESKTRTL